jgi:hypothetical protein
MMMTATTFRANMAMMIWRKITFRSKNNFTAIWMSNVFHQYLTALSKFVRLKYWNYFIKPFCKKCVSDVKLQTFAVVHNVNHP